MVQQELHPEDEGREVDGNPRQPHADAAAEGVPEAVTSGSDRAEAPLDHLHPHAGDAEFQPFAEAQGADATSGHSRHDGPPEAGHDGHGDPVEAAPYTHHGPDEAGFHAHGGAPGEPALAGDMAPGVSGVDVEGMRTTRQGIALAQVKEELVAWVKTLFSAAVYAILIVTFGFQVARVEGQSMAPTLEDQDRLIVNKLVYRIGEPRRGDIVMLYYPLNPDKSFVKRVIAEEGDMVRIVDGRVYVNDVPLRDDYVPPQYRSHDEWGPQVIPEGYYFVMGDHRNNSSDSRHWGMVPKKYIIGKVQLRWWPVPTARVF